MSKYLLINYDNGSHIPFFPQGLAYLAAQLQKDGHEVEIYDMALEHTSPEDLKWCIENDTFDVVGLGFCAGYYQYRVCKALAGTINTCTNRASFKFVLGAHGPAGAPDFFLEDFGADMIVRGEGESVISHVLDFKDDLIHPQAADDPDALPFPAYHLFNIDVYKLISWPTSKGTDFCIPVLSGRGCPFSCTFCYRMDPGFRPRAASFVIEEMLMLHGNYGINHFQFSDELFMSGPGRIRSFLKEMEDAKLKERIPNFRWDCNGRLNYATPDSLGYMKAMGCEYVNYGIESLNQDVLNNIHKGLTYDQIVNGIEATLAAGLFPGLNFMWGNIGDTVGTLKQMVNFLIEYDPCHELRTIRPVTPYPGCALYDKAIQDGKLKDARDFYARHTNSDKLTVNFTDLSDFSFYLALFRANMKLYENYAEKRRSKILGEAAGMYFNDEPFRGWRPV
jgi:anaerobic magnesium-protoporphyrin IX monomethyl ester cyclase